MYSLNPEDQDRTGLRIFSDIYNFCSVYGDTVKWQRRGEVKIFIFLEFFFSNFNLQPVACSIASLSHQLKPHCTIDNGTNLYIMVPVVSRDISLSLLQRQLSSRL